MSDSNVPAQQLTAWEKFLRDNHETKKVAGHNERNQQPILEILLLYLNVEKQNVVLEVGSGTGQHSVFMGNNIPNVVWQPSDYDERCIASVKEWSAGMDNVLCPLVIDASCKPDQWPIDASAYDVVFNCNTIHVAPYEVMEGLIAGAGKACKSGGYFFIYGPFKIEGKCTSESNEAFDGRLKSANPTFGIRDLEDIQTKSAAVGFEYVDRHAMPANNFVIVFRKK